MSMMSVMGPAAEALWWLYETCQGLLGFFVSFVPGHTLPY